MAAIKSPIRRLLASLALVAALIAGLRFAVGRINLSSLDEPGPVESRAAGEFKRRSIAAGAQRLKLSAPPSTGARVSAGGMQYRASCAQCHGIDGRAPSDTGRWMYPRASDLGSPQVQRWSDAELFWIVKHGIRHTGMPGFGKLHDDDRIWDLVFYLREIGKQP